MKILKTIKGGPIVQQFLYSNIAVQEDDGYIVKKAKYELRTSYNRWNRDPVRALQALIGANFTDDAYFITLTFSDEKLPATRDIVSKRYSYFLAKLRQNGTDVKYIKNIEHRHGVGRWHLHVVIEGPTADEIKSAWIYGHCDIKSICIRDVLPSPDNVHYQGGGVANYMVKELRDKPGQRLFCGSRGLARPDTVRQLVDDDYYLYIPDGCLYFERSEPVQNNFGNSVRICYMIPPSEN